MLAYSTDGGKTWLTGVCNETPSWSIIMDIGDTFLLKDISLDGGFLLDEIS